MIFQVMNPTKNIFKDEGVEESDVFIEYSGLALSSRLQIQKNRFDLNTISLPVSCHDGGEAQLLMSSLNHSSSCQTFNQMHGFMDSLKVYVFMCKF